MDSKLIYIKFTNKSIKKIEKYNHLLTDKNIYNKFTIYIWIYYYDKENIDYINNLKKYISINYLSNNELNEINFISNNLCFHNETGKSHLIVYYIGKKFYYLINLDGDDMFYPKFKVNYFEKIINYMKQYKLLFLTRPFWLCFNINFRASFGFSLSSKEILYHLDLMNNINIIKKHNLDQTFSEILTNVKNYTYKDIHFELKDYNWNCGETIEPELLIKSYNSIETRKFKEHEFIVNNHCHIIE
tara:strand:+ start:4956 stop:5687 length:732 start_codon:yes stop_codon:yes gene_type:complete